MNKSPMKAGQVRHEVRVCGRMTLETLESRRLLSGSGAPGETATQPFRVVDGRLTVEAVDAHERVARSGQAWVTITDRGSAKGSAVAALPNQGHNRDAGYTASSPELRFRAVFADAGVYHVWVRASADTGQDDSVHVGLNGTAVASADRISISQNRGWVWSRRTMDGPTATLTVSSPGEQTIHVWMREDGFRLDRLFLTSDASETPNGIGPAGSPRVVTIGPGTPNPVSNPQPRPRPLTPYDDAPWNVTRLGDGERPAFSPDGQRLAYVDRAFGDAWEIDLVTGVHRPLTRHVPHAGILRVHYLPNGDYLLIAPATFTDARRSRWSEAELWVLPRTLDRAPVRLGERVSEGVAIGPSLDPTGAVRLGWGITRDTHPHLFRSWGSALFVANLAYDAAGTPRLLSKREVFRTHETVEAQDFTAGERELIFPRYVGGVARVAGVNLITGVVTHYRDVVHADIPGMPAWPGEYNEPEGIFPDRRSILVESSRGKVIPNDQRPSQYIDLWRLTLTPGSTDYRRLTRWGDWAGFKAANGVISPDGRWLAFHSARHGQTVGEGEGVFLINLDARVPDSVRVFTENFDTPPASAGWAIEGPGVVRNEPQGFTITPPGGTSDAAATTFTRTFDTRGFRNLSVRLTASQAGTKWEAEDYLGVEYDTGYGWTRLLTDAEAWSGVDDSAGESVAGTPGRTVATPTDWLALPVSAENGSARVRITAAASGKSEVYCLLKFEIVGSPVSPATLSR